jgi:aspartyl-tRNA(Asn)/glutamyl-tRNA(Gln) amidotransferase subunit A
VAMELASLSATALAGGYREGAFTPVEVIDALTQQIESINPQINAFTTTVFEQAAADAVRCTQELRGGSDKPLLGIPVAIKDLVDTAGIRTTYGSRIFSGQTPERNARIVDQLIEAGAIIVGKTATHEFAWGFTTDNPHFGPTRNPWATNRISGGSSGGSAAALAAQLVPLAIGTDTGGSIRLPAAYCGVSGLKPSFGSLSLDGIFPLAPSLDHVGPMARTPQDLDLCMAVLRDDYAPIELQTLNGITIAVPDQAAYAELPADMAEIWHDTIATLIKLGAAIRPFTDPLILDCAEVFTAIMVREAAHTHIDLGFYPARLTDYGPDIHARFALASKISDKELAAAKRDRDALRQSFLRIFNDADLMLTLCSSAPPLTIATDKDLPEKHYAYLRETVLRYTAPQNLTGLPAAAVRIGIDGFGLPVGCQFTAPLGRDALAVAAARLFHEATPGLQKIWPSIF